MSQRSASFKQLPNTVSVGYLWMVKSLSCIQGGSGGCEEKAVSQWAVDVEQAAQGNECPEWWREALGHRSQMEVFSRNSLGPFHWFCPRFLLLSVSVCSHRITEYGVLEGVGRVPREWLSPSPGSTQHCPKSKPAVWERCQNTEHLRVEIWECLIIRAANDALGSL